MMYIFLLVGITVIAFLIGGLSFSVKTTERYLYYLLDDKMDTILLPMDRWVTIPLTDVQVYYDDGWHYKRQQETGTIEERKKTNIADNLRVEIKEKQNIQINKSYGVIFSLISLGMTSLMLVLGMPNVSDANGNSGNSGNTGQEVTRDSDDPQEPFVHTDDPESTFDIAAYVNDNSEKMNYSVEYVWRDYDTNAAQLRYSKKNKLVPGIAVSYYQGKIDWNKVKETGVEYVIIRVGYRGYETGKINVDKYFKEYIAGALDSGLKVGVYFFSQAVTAAEIDEEVSFLLEKIKEYDISYPVVINSGRSEEGGLPLRTNDISIEEYVNLQKYFCFKVKEAGYVPVIYDSQDTFNVEREELGDDILDGYLKWVYTPDSELADVNNCVIWQYRQYFEVDGIDGNVSVGFSGFDGSYLSNE